jgi:hypothetical protein
MAYDSRASFTDSYAYRLLPSIVVSFTLNPGRTYHML